MRGLAEQDEEMKKLITDESIPPADTNDEVEQCKVLFVDDEPTVTSSARRILRGEPYEVVTANSAEQALSIMNGADIDIVVSDEQMPGIPGSEFLTIVRLRYPDVIRIMLTGEASLETALDAINNASIFRFLRKPCKANELKACLKSATQAVVERRWMRDSAEYAAIEALSEKERQEKKARFERALERLWMATQPIVSVRDRRVYGYEALVRTDEPTVPHPGVFFGLAGELGRTAELDRRIRTEIPALAANAPPGSFFFVNLAPPSLTDGDLYSRNAPLSRIAGRVVLEITERSSLEHVDSLPERIEMLRALGFRIAVDDLGSGYSGLNSFTTLSPDIVKFDMDLIRDIHRSPTKAKLLQSLSAVCRELGVTSVAEGIETTEELGHLLGLKCSLFQGYLFSRPGRPYPPVNWPDVAFANEAS
jgi:EAL domain-containing protein (putative c-di-GMP-specific phosphodiesterase class I)/CheY-like chemotaxis protein